LATTGNSFIIIKLNSFQSFLIIFNTIDARCFFNFQ
jgi:hypothetical protein